MATTKRNATTHTLIDHQLVVYQRGRSTVWQCRFSVDGRWQRLSTDERDLATAKTRAFKLLVEANVKKENNIAPITRAFKDVAKLAIKRMEKDLADGTGKVIYNDYITIAKNYLIPYFGKYNVNNIDAKLIEQYIDWRDKRMEKAAKRSTVMTHNAILNRIFDEAEMYGFMYKSNRPTLIAKGERGARRVDFGMKEVRALLNNFDAWIDRARAEYKELRTLLRDYVSVLLDTGARPGKELLDLTWAQIELTQETESTTIMEAPSELDSESDTAAGSQHVTLSRTIYMSILTGKTSNKGGRKIVGYENTARALSAIARRNYDTSLEKQIATRSTEKIFVYKEYKEKSDANAQLKVKFISPDNFNKLFEAYLLEHQLLIDPATNTRRVFYSLRHTYATLRLTHDNISIHTLAKQMGTSVQMIERHYSHLDSVKAVKQLRAEESGRLINATRAVDHMYQYDPSIAAKAKKSTIK